MIPTLINCNKKFSTLGCVLKKEYPFGAIFSSTGGDALLAVSFKFLAIFFRRV